MKTITIKSTENYSSSGEAVTISCKIYADELRLNISKQASRKETVAAKAAEVAAQGGPFRGANAVPLKTVCAQGEVMTGINLTLGGTCSGYCDPDGRPVSTFQIQCAKLELK